MRKIILAVVAVVLAVAGVVTALVTVPQLNEQMVRMTCGQPTPKCLVRMRSLGHNWVRRGGLDRAMAWYLRGAEAGDPVAMFHAAWTYEQAFRADLKTFILAYAESQRGSDPDGQEQGPLSLQSADLAEPTLERTHLFGGTLPESRRALIRASARAGEPVRLTLTPTQPDPRLPTFREVTRAAREGALRKASL